MNTCYPTPTEYQTDPSKMADLIFSNSLLSKESQTAIFFGSIASLDALMKRTINNSDQLKSEAAEMYEELFQRFFDSAEVSTSIVDDPDYANSAILQISIDYKQDATWRKFSETVIFLNGKAKKLSEVING